MFRGGEFEDAFNPGAARKHQSFMTKPRPALQMQMELSRLEVPAPLVKEETYYEYSMKSTPTVPVTYDTYYEPENPNADWSGLVSKEKQSRRLAPQSHPGKSSSVVHEEGGLIPREDRQEFQRLRRNNAPLSENSRANIISGIDVQDAERWKTNAQRQNNFEGTSRSQLVLNKRLGVKGEGREAPRSQAVSIATHSSNDPSRMQFAATEQMRDYDGVQNDNTYSLAGYRAPPKLASSSLLSNIGSSVLQRLPEDFQIKRLTAYQPSKDLLAQNYNPAPGYTGSRSRRSNL